MARNVGVNSTFEQQRLVINEIAVDVETLGNAGYITDYIEQDNLGTVLSRGNQATSDILLTGIITATSFVGDGSNLTGISAGAGGTDNVSTSTLNVVGISTFNGRIVGAATTNVIPFLYANLSDLPSPSDYHGAFAHVHATGKAYYAHAGAWIELVNAGTDGTVGTGNENYNVGVVTATTLNASQFVGDGSGLTGVVAEGTGIVIQEEGSSVGTAGTINFIGAGVTATLADGIASVEITSSGSSYANSDVDTHLNVGTASTSEVLSWNGSDYDWVVQSGSGTEISNIVEDTTPQLGGNLDVNGNYITGTGGANITGVVTATRFESTSAGTPTIDSPNNLNINAVTVAISTDLTVGGNVTASQFVGDGSGLTGVVSQGTGIVIQEEGSSVGTAGTINFIGTGVTATLSNGIASVEITSGISTATLQTITDAGATTNNHLSIESLSLTGALTGVGITVTGIVTATSFSGSGSALTGLTGASAGTYGASTNTPIITVDSNGRVTGITTIATSGAGGGGGISNIVEDATPQLGGDLDVNGKDITGTGDINLSGIITATSFVKSSGTSSEFLKADGTVDSSTYLTSYSESDPIVAAINGIVKSNGTTISAATAGTDYLAPDGDGSGLTNISVTESDTLETVTARGDTTTAEITAANFRSNDTTGDGSDIGFAIKYYITSNGASSYLFAGPGVLNSTGNPTLYFHRGFTYILENSTGSGHPFELRVSNGGSAYAPGGSFLSGSINGTQILTVPFNAPNSIVYQCTIHGGMVGTINIVS